MTDNRSYRQFMGRVREREKEKLKKKTKNHYLEAPSKDGALRHHQFSHCNP